MKISCFTLFLLLIAAEQLKAQNSEDKIAAAETLNKEYVQLYKENSEFSYTSPAGEIGAPSKYVINGKLTTNYMLLGTRKLPVAFSIIPDFTVRVRNEKSAGVRTPSFRLGGKAYVRLCESFDYYKYATLAFTHHSNGQDGAALNPDGTINTGNGNFSTNYLTLAYHFGRSTQSATGADQYHTLNHAAGLEWHKWFNYEKALTDDYGFTRLCYDFSLRHYKTGKENWRLNAELNYAINKMAAYDLQAIKKRLNTEVSFHYAFPFMNNVFLMTSVGYYGEDPYNIYYRDKCAYIRLGVSSGFVRHRKNVE